MNLALAVGLTAACLAIVGPTPDLAAPTALAGGAGAAARLRRRLRARDLDWTFGLLGAAVRFCSAESAVRRYLADSSYWLYLAHLPIVFGLQVLLMDVPLHWTIKFPLIVALTLAVLLVSYHSLVRPTFLGELLNGRQYPRRKGLSEPVPGPSAAAAAGPGEPAVGATPIAELAHVTKRYGKTVALDGLEPRGAPRRAARGARAERRRQVDGDRPLARHAGARRRRGARHGRLAARRPQPPRRGRHDAGGRARARCSARASTSR